LLRPLSGQTFGCFGALPGQTLGFLGLSRRLGRLPGRLGLTR
jgi:hypothetical protein